jgi:phosphatidylinositol glycan class S
MDASEPRPRSDAVRTKQPPPPSPESTRTRQLVVLSFWAVVILLGLPIWWKTTTIYRANLPLQSMTDWADGKVCRPTFPLRIAVDASLAPQEVQHLLKTTQHALDDLNDFSIHHLRLVPSKHSGNVSQADADQIVVDDDVALLVRLKPAEDATPTPSSSLHAYAPVLDVLYSPNQIPTSSSTVSPLASYIATELQAIFSEEQAYLAHMLASTTWESPQKVLSPELSEKLSRRSTRSFKYAPTYHITFSLFTPTGTPSDWDIEAALRDYLSPLLASLSSISNFTVDSQIQLYASFSSSIHPEFDADKGHWTLTKDDLSGFINAAEWPLSPNIAAGPTINFIFYVPAAHQSPLVVKENGATGWLIPQWGGVQILNPTGDGGTPDVLTKALLEPAMHTFSNQLLSLLGVPTTPASLAVRLSTLTRLHAASLVFSASSTLGALARLTAALPSIAIPNTVSAAVDGSVARLAAACAALRKGQFVAALAQARAADARAERAFFERSMVGQVYFPDEHKVAVYLPLLGPVAVPLLTSAVKELRKWREARG